MSKIRRQSIFSSFVIYFGFAIGLLNTYFFVRPDFFSEDAYGLYNVFNSLALLICTLSAFAMPSFVFKFYPYYKDHLAPGKSDMITWALIVGTIGFALLLILGVTFQHVIVRKYSANSLLFVNYYYWIFPLGFGLTIYTILEAYAISLHKSVLATFLREVEWRLLTSIFILLYVSGLINFDTFIKLYAFTYPGIALTLLIYLLITKQIHFTSRISKVTKRFLKKIATFTVFLYSGTLIFTISLVFDTLVIASVLNDGLKKAGIFGLATLLTSVIQAPQRGIISASISHLSRAWKEKDMGRIQRIYERSSINQLIFATLLYVLILLNYREAVVTLGLNEDYLLGFDAFIFLGLTRIVDMGTGVNAEIMGTSNYWRFQLVSGIVLLTLMLPLTYFFAKEFDILGPAIANFISISIYNAIRMIFLWKKFRLQPFNRQTLYTILTATTVYIICHYLFSSVHGWAGLFSRSAAAAILFITVVVFFRFSPDIDPVWETVKKRLGIKAK